MSYVKILMLMSLFSPLMLTMMVLLKRQTVRAK